MNENRLVVPHSERERERERVRVCVGNFSNRNKMTVSSSDCSYIMCVMVHFMAS